MRVSARQIVGCSTTAAVCPIHTGVATAEHVAEDWGKGPVVAFSRGWPLNADAWDARLLFRAQNGFRVITHDRRGHGRERASAEYNV